MKEEDYALNELSLAAEYFPEGYISFLAALKYYGWTTQLPVTIQVVTTKSRTKKKFQEITYVPVRISEKKFCGYQTVGNIKIATKEKLVIDCFSHPKYCAGLGEICNALRRESRSIKWASVRYFSDRAGNSATERRLTFCLKFLHLKNALKHFEKKKFKGYRLLDPSAPAKGRFDSKYGLRLNVVLDEEMK
ncbi:MAG: type IV toxin-antitoxin system AbiEi family antitoxin [Candidatus Micrarchaeia archaeon]